MSFSITLTRIIEADISAAVVLISMGALLGRTTPIQLLLMSLIEVIVYAANEFCQLELLKVYILNSRWILASRFQIVLSLVCLMLCDCLFNFTNKIVRFRNVCLKLVSARQRVALIHSCNWFESDCVDLSFEWTIFPHLVQWLTFKPTKNSR